MKQSGLLLQDADLLASFGLVGLDFAGASRQGFDQGEYIVRQGEPLRYLYFVVSGRAKVCLGTPGGKRLLLSSFMHRGVIGDVEMMTGRAEFFSTVQAVTAFVCVALPLNAYGSALRSNARFLEMLGRELAQKLIARDAIAGAALHPLEARLCAYLLQASDGGVFRETLTETAELLGTSYRHLLRTLGALCGAGALVKQPSGYLLADIRELEKKACGLYPL